MFEVSTAEDALRVLQETDAEFITVGIVDTQGTLRGKYLSRRKFESALRDGMGVPAVTLGLDFHDVMAANSVVGGADTGYFDALVRVIPESCREIPWEPPRRNLFFQLEYVGDTAAVCTRNVLQRVLERAQGQGLVPITGLEYEFTLFKETSDTVVAKGHRNLQVATPHSTYYVLQRQSAWAEFYSAIMDTCRSLGIALDSMHEEMGPGFMEATIAYGSALRVADDAAVFKSYAKAVAARRDLLLSFMARWSNDADGHSGHLHLSLRDIDRTPVLHDPDGPDGLSETAHHMLGGMQSAAARAAADAGAERQLVQALRAGHLRADRGVLGRREPFVRAAGHPGHAVGGPASSAGCRAPTRTRTSSPPRWSAPPSTASSTGSSPNRPCSPTRTRPTCRRTSRSPARSATASTASARPRSPASCSATRSSTTTPTRASGRSASSAHWSPTASWSASSSSPRPR